MSEKDHKHENPSGPTKTLEEKKLEASVSQPDRVETLRSFQPSVFNANTDSASAGAVSMTTLLGLVRDDPAEAAEQSPAGRPADIEPSSDTTSPSANTPAARFAADETERFNVPERSDSGTQTGSTGQSATTSQSVSATAPTDDILETGDETVSLPDRSGGGITSEPVDGGIATGQPLVSSPATAETVGVAISPTAVSTPTQSSTPPVAESGSEGISAISDSNTDTNQVDENAPIGSLVGITAKAIDDDASDTVSYSLSDDAGGLFEIDPATGVVTVAGSLDRETATSHTIQVEATSSDGSKSVRSFTIDINDLNDEAPTDITHTGGSVDEGAVAGTPVATLSTVDADASNSFSYTLTSDPSGFFEISGNQIQVKAGANIDYETATSHNVTVQVGDGNGNTYSEVISLSVNDLNDETPTDITLTGGSVNEGATAGTTVANLSTVDADASNSFSYSITSDPSGFFEISGNQIQVKAGANIDYETATSHDVTVQVDDGNGNTYSEVITLSVNDLNDETPTDITLAGGSVNEGATAGTTVATLSTVDADASNSFSYSITSDPSGFFEISGNQIQVKAGANIDYETVTSHNVTVQVDDGNGNTYSEVISLSVNDLNDETPTDITLTGGSVNEGATAGTTVATLSTVDADASNSFSYSITSDPSGFFEISGNQIQVKAGANIDYETATNHNVTVQVDDGNGNTYSEVVTLNVNDLNNEAPTDITLTGGSVNEGASGGTTVATLSAVDPDSSNSFSYSITSDPSGFFEISGNQIQVKAGANIDYETATSHNVTVQVDDGNGNTYSEVITLNVSDLNDETPTDITLTGGSVNEGATAGTTVATLSTVDADASNSFSYTLTSDPSGFFEISGNQIQVKAGANIDYETATSHNVTVQVDDGNGNTYSEVISLSVNDLNDETPTDITLTGGSVNEGATAGTTVATLSTVDADASNSFSYTLTSDPSGFFEISGNQIQVKAGANIDYETATSHNVTVQVDDGNGNTYSEVISLNVNDLNDETPTDITLTGGSVNEGATAGTTVATLSTVDADASNSFSYTLTSDPSGFFEISGNQIQVKAGANIDYETATSHNVTVQVDDGNGNTYSEVISLSVNDLNDETPTDITLTGGSVNEGATAGTTVATLSTVDADASNSFSYTLTSDPSGFFEISGNQIQVKAGANIDYETATSHNVTVQVDDGNGNTYSEVISLSVNDLNDETPTDITLTGGSVNEGATAGTTVATLSTVDADASNSFSYTLTSDPSGFFEISGNQIQVKAGANIDYETATSHNVTVQVDDGNGNTYSEVISLSVNDLNDETPTDITLTGGSVNEGAASGTTVATLSTVDADASNSFSYTLTSDPSGFFEISGNNVQVKAGANIDYETATSHDVTVQVDDGNGNTYSEVISLSVNDLNDETPTDITLTGGSVNEGATAGTTVATLSTVDADASNSFSYSITSDPSGFFEISGNQIQVKAGASIDYETATSHDVTVQVDDGNGNTYSEVISLSVNDLNDETPTDITLTGGSVNEGATAGTTVATLSTVDADASNSFSYSITSDPSGFFEISGNQIQVKAGASIDYETATSHDVTVQVDDGNGNTYSEVITLSVNDLNDETPTDITLTGGSVNEGATAGTTVATLSTVDADASNSFSYSITSDPSGFFEISGNQIQVKAGANIDYETATSHNVTVQVDDGNGNTYSEVISLSVNDLNDETPTDITLTGGSVNEGATAGTTVATLSTVDADASNSFSYSITSDPSGFFEISGNQIQVKAGANIDYETATSHNVTVQVDDGNGNTYSEVISLSVNDLNDETPTDITLTGGSVNEGATAGTTVATLSTVDADASNSFSYSITSDPSGFFDISGNTIQVKAGANIDYETATSHNVTVQVDDGNGNTYSEVISLSVNDLNDETPTDITLTGGSVNEGATAGTTVATLSTVDADASNSFSYTLTSDPSGFFEISGNQIQVKAGANIDYETATSHNVTVQVDDGNGNTYSEVISLSVNDLNDETPTDITLTGGSVNEGATAGTTVATLSTVDADASNSFSYTLTSDPSGFFEISGNTIQVKAGANIDYETATSHNVTVQVDDGNGNTYSEVISLSVNDLNDETPTDITLTGGSVNEGATAGTTVATLSTVDADASNSFSYTLTSDPSGFFEISGNQIQVKAGANIDYENATSHNVTVQVDDGNGNTYSEVISLSVNDLNDETPTDITLTGGSVNEGATAGTTVATLSTVDADASNSFSYTLTSDPSGFFEISGNQIQVKAGANIDYENATSHNVTVQVDDGNGNTYSEVITLSVNDLNDETPTDITLTGGSVNEGATAGTTVATLSTVDADASNSFSYTLTSDPSGFFEISGNQIQVKAGANIDYETATSHNVTVQVDDGNGNTYSEVISLSVNDLNDETPTDITLTGGSVNEGATAGTTVATLSAVDADASNSFSYSITSDPSGFFEISGNQIQVKAGANIDYETATSHNVTVQVDDGNGNTYSEVITLSVNDLNDETPTDITLTGGSVNEGATAGTTVATLSTVDADASNSFSYTLTSDPSGFFEISGNQIQVKAGASIDYETATSHNVTVQVDDGNGNTYSEVISLSVSDLNDETPTDITLTGGSVNEGATAGTTVATLSAVDADASNSFSYSITSDPSGFFEISGNQIQVKAGANIDYETATSHNVTVQVDDGNGNTYSEVITLSVNDLNDETPTDITLTGGSVNEGATAGTTVATLSTVDADASNSFSYTLTSDPSGFFEISGNQIQVKAGASIDYETATSHDVTIRVDDGNGNTYSEVITLSVNDLNDETPTDITLTGGSVNEGATAGTTVATLSTVDADASNSFSYSLTSDPSGFFEISGNQIQVKAGANIDYETATSHDVTVQVDDGNGNTYSEVITLSVNDLNDETPTDITLTGGSVNEGATAGTTVATLSTVDADASNSFSYALTSDPSGFFEISGNQIQVKAGANIDYETATSHNVTVQVDDGNGNTYSEVITLSVNDLNDETPTDITLTGGSVNEGATAGTTVATLSTVDADASNSFSYALTSDPSGFFEISGNQIQVKAGANIDYETATSHNVTVQVDDGNGNTYSEVITLSVNDLNDETPTDITLTGGSVNEGATAGTTVATLSTVDADASNSFSYSITSDPSGFFEISGNQIQVKAGANIDYETATSHNVTVQVDDGNGNTYSEVISLSVNDLNDETPTDITLTGGSVNEGATAGTTVATLSTVDADASNSFSYSITSDPSGFFEISGNQIQVKAGANIDYETATSHDVTVQVDDGNGNTYSEVITLNVNDLNDETPTDITLTGGSVNEGATAGTTVATLSTVDADASNSFSYSITSDPSGFFEISGNQIQVKAGANIDYETATSHNVTVQVDDGNSNTYSEVISLSVNDLNDETPTDITLTGGSVNEGATAGTTVATLSTVDADASNSFSYSITSDPSGFFEISGNQIQVKAGSNIDYETATSHNVTVQVDDGNGNTYSEVISLSVNDLNDETPTDITLTGGSVNEGATAGTTVATLSTVDADASNSFSYSITSDPSGFFEISGNQIQVKAGANIDYETATSHNVTVQVDDGNGNTYSEVISLSVNDINEAPTDIDFTSAGSVLIGSPAGTVASNDPDAGDTVNYTLLDDANGMFSINGSTGQLTWNGILGDPEFTLQSGTDNPFNGVDVGSYSIPTLVDIDNDGDLDMYIGDDDGNLDFYRNTGSENAPSFTYVGVGTYGFSDNGSYSGVTFGDIDNDGDLDAFVGDTSGNTYYYQNTGTAGSPSFTLVGSNQFGLTDVGDDSTVKLVDIDNDGDLDMFVGNINGDFTYFQNTGTAGSPSFAAGVINPFGLSDTGRFSNPEFADIDGDGDLDMIVGDEIGNFELRENTGTAASPSFAAASNDPYGTSAQSLTSAWTLADIDGDGDLDAITGGSDGKIYTYLDTAERTVDTSTVNSYDITVRATDAGGLSTQETMTITTGTNGSSTPGSSGTINTGNYTTTGAGYTVTAQNVVGGALTTASLSNVGTYGGTFAADGTVSDSDSGVAAQTGYDKASGLSERLIVDFDNDLSSASFSFNYLYTGTYGEVGHWAVYNNGILVAEADFTEASFGSGSGTVNINPGTNFDQLILTANLQTDLSDGSDYGIASISYQEAPIVSAGNDTLTGHATQDNLMYGLAGDDSLTGGSGDDVLVGGAGADALSGGAGTDTADYSTSSAAVTVNLDTGSGTGGDAAGDTYIDIEAIIASDYDDYVYGLDTGGVTVNLGAGNDTFDNDIGDSTQTDTINGGAGNDTIWGGAGNDILSGDSGNDNIHGESGDDTLSGGAGTDTFTGGDGADTITGGTGNDTAYGGNGDDTFVYFIGDGDDSYYGGNSGSWTDTIQLADGTASLGTYGADWTISISQGSIDQTLSNEVVFSQDSAGQIVLQDGSTITFQEIERVVF